MKSKLSVLAAAMLLFTPIPAQAAPLDNSSVPPPRQIPLSLVTDAPPPTAPTASLVCTPVPAGAVAWWRAESNTVDTVGVNDLLFDVAPPRGFTYIPGKVGAAFRLLSYPAPLRETNYLFAPASAELDVGAGAGLTIEGWLSPSGITGLQPVAEWSDAQGNVGAGLALDGSSLEATLTDTNSSPIRRVVFRSTPGLFATSVWHHVALTFDKTAGHATAFVDGLPVAQTNIGAFRPATRAQVNLGFRPSGTNINTRYLGGLDELTIYNRALAAAELQSIVAADSAGKCVPPPPLPVPPPAGFVGWWRGESNALDSVDSNNGITIGRTLYTNGVVGKAFLFETNYVRIPAASNLDLGLGPGFTVETWVYPAGLTPTILTLAGEFIGWHNSNVTQGVTLSFARLARRPPFPPFPPFADYTTVWEANVADTQGRSHILDSPADLATVGVWQHVALTYDKATGTAVLYFNGNPVTQTNLGSFTPQTRADFNLGYQPSIPIPFRASSSDALDEVSLYARALSPAEIRAIMLSRGTGKSKDPPVVVSNPVSVRASLGGSATFTVTVSGNPILRYQWRRNGFGLPGATGSSLVLTNVQLAQTGTYSVRVTNAFGVALSSNAVLTINQPPVADASATPPVVIAPLHCDATVVLDGSRSFDPDGDPLHYFWFKAGAASPLATGVVAVVTLPPGVYALTLVVDDGMATNSESFTVQVLTLAQALERLINLVTAQAPKPQPLVASLSAALRSINRSEPTPAINQLHAFENKTRAQVARSDPALAQTFIQSAQQLVAILSAGCSPARPPARIARAERGRDGRLRMHFSAPQGFVYILEASTNLVDWEKIGVATDGGSGEFDCEDAAAPQMPARFYRLVVP